MNHYLKVPRGLNVNNLNDLIIRKTIEAIGKKYGTTLLGYFRSNYAKGKAYLAKKYGISKTALKNLHKTKISISGYNNIGVNFGNYMCIHVDLAKEILECLIAAIKERDIDFVDIITTTSHGKYGRTSLYINALFEESVDWMDWSLRNEEDFNAFNNHNNAHEELRRLYEAINDISDVIGG